MSAAVYKQSHLETLSTPRHDEKHADSRDEVKPSDQHLPSCDLVLPFLLSYCLFGHAQPTHLLPLMTHDH